MTTGFGMTGQLEGKEAVLLVSDEFESSQRKYPVDKFSIPPDLNTSPFIFIQAGASLAYDEGILDDDSVNFHLSKMAFYFNPIVEMNVTARLLGAVYYSRLMGGQPLGSDIAERFIANFLHYFSPDNRSESDKRKRITDMVEYILCSESFCTDLLRMLETGYVPEYRVVNRTLSITGHTTSILLARTDTSGLYYLGDDDQNNAYPISHKAIGSGAFKGVTDYLSGQLTARTDDEGIEYLLKIATNAMKRGNILDKDHSRGMSAKLIFDGRIYEFTPFSQTYCNFRAYKRIIIEEARGFGLI
jgi:hypothetical protein